MAEGGLGSGGIVGVPMVAAAVGAMLPQQEMTRRGSQATQSLIADTMNEVVKVSDVGRVAETAVQAAAGAAVGAAAGGGSKLVEAVGVQAVGVLLPMAANAIRSTCARRNDVQGVQTPPTPRKPVSTPELSPIQDPETIHHRISSENSADEGFNYPSEDLNQTQDSLERRVNGYLYNDQERNISHNRIEIKELEKKFETESRVNTFARHQVREQMQQIEERNKSILDNSEEIAKQIQETQKPTTDR